ncbi:MAG: ATP-dependent zinc metalloprotease FtsH [Chloroflexi bacterium]|nr:ATP-dependent zinc metalloprotease FtsH [Chloroflexota bacterium]MBV9595490.1 ATP-dependent zinc metalloprotease FtsH [Chloroflexota bacterium]
MQPKPWWISFVIVLVLNYLLVQVFLPERPNPRIDVPYTFFKQQVTADNVVEVTSQGDTIQGTFKNAVTYPDQPQQGQQQQTSTLFETVQPTFADPGLETLLEQHNVTINAHSLDVTRSWWQNLLLSFGPTILLIGLFFWISSRAASQLGGSSGPFGLGRSRAKRYDQTSDGAARITFADVAGIDEAKGELEEIVDFLRDPSKYTRLGGAVPKGVLLIGAPGTGKTLLARAVAGEANVPFFSMGASEFVEMIVGVGASRVRDLFKQAREAAPAIIFIDELDAIGRARGTGAFGGNDEREQTLNQILTEMDGFSSREGVIVLAATNRPDVLDQALLRPGRFDRRVTVNPPDKVGREAILRVHTRGVPLASDVDLKIVASSTPGLVGADLRNLVNEAALMAARRNEDRVHQTDFLDALEKLVLGPARSVVMSPAERERVAYHEGGHTILGLLVPGADPVNRVTIMPRGQALGVTYQRPEDDRHNYSEEYLRARITGAMGGRAAEEVVYGGRTTGAENDIQQATDLARQMVTRWGMSEKLGPVTLSGRDDPFLRGDALAGLGSGKPYSESTAKVIDDEVERILQECYAEGVRLLSGHRDALDRLAHALLEHETLDEREILQVTQLHPAPRTNEAPIAVVPAAAFSAADAS